VNSFRKPLDNKDYTLWYEMGQLARSEQSLYQPGLNGEVRYMYPPTMAVMVYGPLSLFPQPVFVVAVAALTAIAWAFSLLASFQLILGKWAGHPRWYYLVPLLATGPYVYDLFLLGQINLVLLALVLASPLLNRTGRPGWAGACLGLAIAIKVFPLPLLAYWILRQSWWVVLSCILSLAVAVAVVPGLSRGFERTQTELGQWFQLMVGDQSGNAMAARSSIGFTRRNQSLVSLSHRLLRDVEAGDRDGVGFTVNFANVPPRTAQAVGYGMCLLLGLLFLVVTRLRLGISPEAEACEIGMACVGIVLLSPLSWTYFFCWLIPAWVIVCTQLRTHRWLKFPTILAGLLLFSALSELIHPQLQAYGVTAWGSVVLYLSLAFLRNRIRKTSTDSPPPWSKP
jgi:alpha-1,2-mannosyltransferase